MDVYLENVIMDDYGVGIMQYEYNESIQYHVACEASGSRYMKLLKSLGSTRINRIKFIYCNTHGHLIDIPERLGSAQAVYHDITALKWVCKRIEKNYILNSVACILASRIRPFEKICSAYTREVYQNPDGKHAIMVSTEEKPVKSRLLRPYIAHHNSRIIQFHLSTSASKRNSLSTAVLAAA